jgi:hypothetical protein
MHSKDLSKGTAKYIVASATQMHLRRQCDTKALSPLLHKGTTKDLVTLSPVRHKGTFVVYATNTRCYLVQDDETTHVYRCRYKNVVFDEKSANLYLPAYTTPAPLPTSAPTKEFLEALQRAMTRQPSTHTHTHIRWLVTYMVLTAEQLPVPEQHARARASRASNTLHADQRSKGHTTQQACCAVSRIILSMPAAADSRSRFPSLGSTAGWSEGKPLRSEPTGAVQAHQSPPYTNTAQSYSDALSSVLLGYMQLVWTDEKATKKAAKTATNIAKRVRFT